MPKSSLDAIIPFDNKDSKVSDRGSKWLSPGSAASEQWGWSLNFGAMTFSWSMMLQHLHLLGDKTYPWNLLSPWAELYFSGPFHNADFTEGLGEKGREASAGREVWRGEYLTLLPTLRESAGANGHGHASSYVPDGSCKTGTVLRTALSALLLPVINIWGSW